MKIVGGAVAFIAFVAGLMALAYFTSQPKTSSTSTNASTKTATSATGSMPSTNTPSATDAAPSEQFKPVLLPPLSVYKDDKDPKAIALAGARSKPILLHLWASWCGPCRAELPSLMQFAKKGPADLVAVSVDDHFGDVEKFFHGHIPNEVVWDKTISLERTLGVENIPTTFLVDTKGYVVDRFDGAQPWDNPELAKAVADDLK